MEEKCDYFHVENGDTVPEKVLYLREVTADKEDIFVVEPPALLVPALVADVAGQVSSYQSIACFCSSCSSGTSSFSCSPS